MAAGTAAAKEYNGGEIRRKEFGMESRKERTYDVIVAGGGPSGVAAAVAAARYGCKTLIIEREACLGGMAALAGVPAFGPYTNGETDLIGGIGREILENLKKECYISPFYDRKPDRIEGLDWFPIDPEILKRILDRMVKESGCEVLFHTVVTGAKMEGTKVTGVEIPGAEVRVTEAAAECCGRRISEVSVFNKGGAENISAEYFIDCTGDGDLAAFSGAEWQYGDENGRVQAGTLCFRVAGIDVAQFMEYADREGENGNLSVACEKAKRDGHFPLDEGKVGGFALEADGVAGLNFGHVYNLQPLNAWDLSRAEMEAREKLPEYVAFLREYVPGMERCVLVQSGPYLGIRESRRICGLYTLTAEDYKNRADFPDSIAYYSYPIDMHASVPEENRECDDVYRNSKYANGECYGIPYRSLIPKGFDNLAVAGRIISADRAMMASVRIMSACFATGQAAGTAAALCVRDTAEKRRKEDEQKAWAAGMSLAEVNTERLRKELKTQKVYIKE